MKFYRNDLKKEWKVKDSIIVRNFLTTASTRNPKTLKARLRQYLAKRYMGVSWDEEGETRIIRLINEKLGRK